MRQQNGFTPADLLEESLHGKRSTRRPCICPGGMMNMLTAQLMDLCGVCWPEAHLRPAVMAELAAAVYTNQLFDNIGVPFCMTVEAESMGAQVDLGDRYTEPRVTSYPISSVDGWRDLPHMDLSAGRPKVVLEALSMIEQRYPDAAITGSLTGPVSLASSLADAACFYKDLRKKRENAHALMEFVTDNLIAFGKAQIESGASFIAISDPSGTGEILGPKLFEEYALPALNRLCRALRPLCRGVIVHICGRLQSIYPQLAQLECDAISFDAVVSIRDVLKNVPGKAVMGNVSTFALAGGTPQTVRGLCRGCLKSGVNILAPACGLGTTTPLENIRILMETVKEEAHAADNGNR